MFNVDGLCLVTAHCRAQYIFNCSRSLHGESLKIKPKKVVVFVVRFSNIYEYMQYRDRPTELKTLRNDDDNLLTVLLIVFTLSQSSAVEEFE